MFLTKWAFTPPRSICVASGLMKLCESAGAWGEQHGVTAIWLAAAGLHIEPQSGRKATCTHGQAAQRDQRQRVLHGDAWPESWAGKESHRSGQVRAHHLQLRQLQDTHLNAMQPSPFPPVWGPPTHTHTHPQQYVARQRDRTFQVRHS